MDSMGKTGRMDLFRGTLDMLVLQVLHGDPSHGYAIARAIERSTHDVLRIEEGSLYPALYRMEKRGLIESAWGTTDTNRRAKIYSLTSAGREYLVGEVSNWSEFTDAVSKLLTPGVDG
jgi:transcriptional regulator